MYTTYQLYLSSKNDLIHKYTPNSYIHTHANLRPKNTYIQTKTREVMGAKNQADVFPEVKN